MKRIKTVDIALIVIAGLAVVGIADALYLSIASSTMQPVGCSLLEGCKSVLSSSWSRIFGISTAVYGVSYYTVSAILASAYWYWRDQAVMMALFVIVTLGLLASVWFVYLQFFVINALCEYCLVSAGITMIIWGVTTWIFINQTITG